MPRYQGTAERERIDHGMARWFVHHLHHGLQPDRDGRATVLFKLPAGQGPSGDPFSGEPPPDVIRVRRVSAYRPHPGRFGGPMSS